MAPNSTRDAVYPVERFLALYVDDATESGAIGFDNGALFFHEGSAHKMLDYRELGTRNVWLLFNCFAAISNLRGVD
jgi:hypothetical protein